jgi:hypothetical protein
VYELLSESEDKYMPALQRMLRRVSRELNKKDWSAICEVTDDFVIAPADGSQFFAGDQDYADLVKSIPPKRLALLRSRGLLGPDETGWEARPGY